MPQSREEMPAIVGDHHIGISGAGDVSNVRVIDTAPDDVVTRRSLQKWQACQRRKIVNSKAAEDLFLEQARGIGSGQSKFGRHTRRD